MAVVVDYCKKNIDLKWSAHYGSFQNFEDHIYVQTGTLGENNIYTLAELKYKKRKKFLRPFHSSRHKQDYTELDCYEYMMIPRFR